MSTICGVYRGAPPNFPATDQQPGAVRYGPITVGSDIVFVDAIGPQPSVAELNAVLHPPPADPIDIWDVVSLTIAFNHENRIRVLEGKAAITVAQFKTAVRNLVT